MFRTYKSKQINNEEEATDCLRWELATIELSKPILLVTFKYKEDDVDQIGTHMFASLDGIEFHINRRDLPLKKIQIMVPDGLGWVLLDIVTIRRCSFLRYASEDESELNEYVFEEFITSCGECFTFQTLSVGELNKSPHEIVYQAGTKHSSV